jgi:hypothetical protein
MRINWTDELTNSLVAAVKTRQADGMSENAAIIEAAKILGVGYDPAYQRYRRVAGKFAPIPQSRYPKYNSPVLPAGDYLCLGDLHAPHHDADFINRSIIAAQAAGVTRCIVGGDWLDNEALSAWPEDFKPAPNVVSGQAYDRLMEIANRLTGQERQDIIDTIGETSEGGDLQAEIKSVRAVLTALNDNFDEIYYIMGNHESWLIRKLQKSIGSADFAALFMGNSPKAKIVPFYHLTFESGGESWRAVHPKPTAKGVSAKLAAKYHQHVIMFHNHQFSVKTDISGKYLGIEPGMCLDEARAHYVMVRDTAADAHVTGAVIVQAGKFRLLNKWTV